MGSFHQKYFQNGTAGGILSARHRRDATNFWLKGAFIQKFGYLNECNFGKSGSLGQMSK